MSSTEPSGQSDDIATVSTQGEGFSGKKVFAGRARLGWQRAHQFGGDGFQRPAVTLGPAQDEGPFHARQRGEGDGRCAIGRNTCRPQLFGQKVDPGPERRAHDVDQARLAGGRVDRDSCYGDDKSLRSIAGIRIPKWSLHDAGWLYVVVVPLLLVGSLWEFLN